MKRKNLLILLLTMVVLALVPTIGSAAGSVELNIGNGSVVTTYSTFDEAVTEYKAYLGPEKSAVITLDDNYDSAGFALNGKSLTVKSASPADKKRITMVNRRITIENNDLTLLNMELYMTNNVSGPSNIQVGTSASGKTNFIIDNSTVNLNGGGQRTYGIAHQGANGINITTSIENGSTVVVENFTGAGYFTESEERDLLRISGGSTVSFNGNRAGMITGTAGGSEVHVSGSSTLNVQNNTGNGSNGGDWYVDASTLNFEDNGSFGLSVATLDIKNKSLLNCNGNNLNGIHVMSGFDSEDSTIVAMYNGENLGRPGALLLVHKHIM